MAIFKLFELKIKRPIFAIFQLFEFSRQKLKSSIYGIFVKHLNFRAKNHLAEYWSSGCRRGSGGASDGSVGWPRYGGGCLDLRPRKTLVRAWNAMILPLRS